MRTRRFRHAGMALVGAGCVLAIGLTSLPGGAETSPRADAGHVHVPPGQEFFENTSTGEDRYAAFTTVFDASVTNADGTRDPRYLLSYKTKPDNGTAFGGAELMESRDPYAGPDSWAPADLPDQWTQTTNMFRLADEAGTLVAVDFEDTTVTDPPGDRMEFRRQLLVGDEWRAGGVAKLHWTADPNTAAWARFHQAPLLSSDGKTLLTTVYATSTDGKTTWISVVRSRDAGKNWTEVSRLVSGPYANWTEATIAQTSHDGLIVAMRKEWWYSDPGQEYPYRLDLYATRSANLDGTGPWTEPAIVSSESGASPMLRMMGNGVLALSSGRIDNIVRFSLDGTGATFAPKATVYQNRPSSGTGGGTPPRPLEYLGSSGYVGLAGLSANQILAVGDNCASGWGCPTTATQYTQGDPPANSLWLSRIEADTGQWGKVDLRRKFQHGDVDLVDTNLTTYGLGRKSLAAYAFDGDPRSDSSVVSGDRRVTVRLDRAYQITGLGMHVHRLGEQDVTIQTSTDPDCADWSTPERGTRSGIVRPFAQPTKARCVRISDPNPTDRTAAQPPAFLNELELYTTTAGFENDYPGEAPRGNGISSARMATVVESDALEGVPAISSRFLRLVDTSEDDPASASWAQPSTSAAKVGFRVRSYGDSKALTFTLKGTSGSGDAANAYHFHLDAAGNLYRYRYAEPDSWGEKLNDAPIRIRRWNTIEVNATAGSEARATLRVNGADVANVRLSQPASKLDGFELGSAGSDPTGDDWLIDDLTYTRR